MPQFIASFHRKEGAPQATEDRGIRSLLIFSDLSSALSGSSFLGKEPSAACGGSAAYGSKNLHNRACGPLEIHPYPRLRRYFS